MSPRLEWCRSHAAEMEALLAELVRIESPSTDPRAVAALASRVAAELAAVGLDAELLSAPQSGPIVRARSGDRPVMLLGHLDTVWTVGTLARLPVRVADGRLYGPGCYDMKGGIVVLLWALRALAAEGRMPPVCVYLTPLEELGGPPYRPEMEREMRRCRAVLGFEPAWPGGAVKTRRKGSTTIRLRARGVAAHAGADFRRGANAIVELSRRLVEIAALTDAGRGVTVNVGTVRGGTRANVVPGDAEAEVDVRFPTLADARRVSDAVAALRPEDPRVTLEVEPGPFYPPMERSEGVAAAYEVARAAAREVGLPDLDEVSTGGASEASFAAALGIPTLDGLGPDGDGAHADGEHVVLASLAERAALASRLIEKLIEP
jgi:glutamate carboxypeptidase